MKKEPLKVFIGYDSSEERAFNVCAKSILRRASQPVQIYPLRQDWLRSLGIYWRERELHASTEFSISRFLAPVLCGDRGPVLYIDSDFLFLADVAELFALYDPRHALSCVQHVYRPLETMKMGAAIQTINRRKNWSSLILWNSGHPLVRSNLTPHEVNTRSPAWLHQFEWCDEKFLGALPIEWNSIEGHNDLTHAKAIHFSRGVPGIHPGDFECADLWTAEEKA